MLSMAALCLFKCHSHLKFIRPIVPELCLGKNINFGQAYHKYNRATNCLATFSRKSSTIMHPLRFVTTLINNNFNILVMVGAGLSTPSGIPDFRTPGTGLYNNLQEYNLPYPEAIFDINYFMMDPLPFFTLARDLYPGLNYKPNIGHFFIRLLNEENKLLKIYTQNIDGLERIAGIPIDKIVEAHGTFSSASCTLCGKNHKADYVKKCILSGQVPVLCRINNCKGKVKPDIVFFGENLPSYFWDYERDASMADLLIVIGTSLEIHCSSLCLRESSCSGFCYDHIRASCDLYQYHSSWYGFVINQTTNPEISFDESKGWCDSYGDMLITPQNENDNFFSTSVYYSDKAFYLGYLANGNGSYTNIYTGSTLDLWSWNKWNSTSVNNSNLPITRGMPCVYLEDGLFYENNCTHGIHQAYCIVKPCSWIAGGSKTCYVRVSYVKS